MRPFYYFYSGLDIQVDRLENRKGENSFGFFQNCIKLSLLK